MVEWYCQVMGSEVGPLSQEQLVDMARQHRLTPEDLVRRNNSSWVPAFQVKGLFEAAARPPKPKPEPKPTEAIDEQNAELERNRAILEEKRSAVQQSAANLTRRINDPVESDTTADWFCIASGEKRGPLGFDELKELVRQGDLRGRDRVWRGSWPKYQSASEIDGLDFATS